MKRLLTGLLLGANICAILLLWLTAALTYMPPAMLPRLSLLTLAFPVLLCANAAFLIPWLLFHARLAWVPLAGMLPVAGFIMDYSPIRLSTPSEGDDCLTVVTYNMGGAKTPELQDEVAAYLREADADLVFLQETQKNFVANHTAWIDSAAYHVVQTGELIVLTRLPVLSDTISIHYPTRSNHSFACWLDLGGDSLLVVNNHLESNHLSPEEKDEYANTVAAPNREAIRSSSRHLAAKLSEAATYRGAQADSLRAFVRQHQGHPVILCGDLNDTPVSYAYQRLARCLPSAYREAGSGPGFTFSRRLFPVRIDHLFHSPHWHCTSCRVERAVTASDHYPVSVRLCRKKR